MNPVDELEMNPVDELEMNPVNDVATQVNQNGFVYGTFSDMVTKRHLYGRK